MKLLHTIFPFGWRDNLNDALAFVIAFLIVDAWGPRVVLFAALVYVYVNSVLRYHAGKSVFKLRAIRKDQDRF